MGETDSIPNLADTRHFKMLQENIKKKQVEKIAIDEAHVEFLENLQTVRTEVDAQLQKNYCIYGSKLES